MLPVILAYQKGSAKHRREITRCLSGRCSATEALQAIAVIFGETGALAESVQIAQQHAESAIVALSVLPSGPGRDLLNEYATKAVNRRH